MVQAGNGKSITFTNTNEPVTLDETDYGTDSGPNMRKTILNNNIVKYQATYNINTNDSVALSLTMPANSTIDSASITTGTGCSSNSKLESIATNGNKSYTPNKATCIVENKQGVFTWEIVVYPWGANKDIITPSLAIDNESQTITNPDDLTVTVISRPNYRIYNQTESKGNNTPEIDRQIGLAFGLYTPIEDNLTGSGDAVIGIEPLKEPIEIRIDATNLPEGWEVGYCKNSVSQAGTLSVSYNGNSAG